MARRGWRWAVFASILWAGCVVAYGIGYVGTTPAAGMALALSLAGLLAALILPIAGALALGWGFDALLAGQSGADVAALEARIAALDKRVQTLEARKPPERAPPPPPRPAPPPPEVRPEPEPEAEAQPTLPLEGGGDGLSVPDTVKALNFPKDAGDREGFAVLSRAMAEPDLARLIRSAEDCLTLLAHEGLYMDDLMPAPASAADWRQFAEGGLKRAALLPLTGITDQAALETVRTTMRGDAIFRDTALHFQRKFDQMLHRVAPEATDGDLLDLVDTRSGRAYVLLVQVGS